MNIFEKIDRVITHRPVLLNHGLRQKSQTNFRKLFFTYKTKQKKIIRWIAVTMVQCQISYVPALACGIVSWDGIQRLRLVDG